MGQENEPTDITDEEVTRKAIALLRQFQTHERTSEVVGCKMINLDDENNRFRVLCYDEFIVNRRAFDYIFVPKDSGDQYSDYYTEKRGYASLISQSKPDIQVKIDELRTQGRFPARKDDVESLHALYNAYVHLVTVHLVPNMDLFK